MKPNDIFNIDKAMTEGIDPHNFDSDEDYYAAVRNQGKQKFSGDWDVSDEIASLQSQLRHEKNSFLRHHIQSKIDQLENMYDDEMDEGRLEEKWSQKYKSSINCSHPKGFSQRAHCAGKKKHNESVEMEMTCPDCGMCETHGDHSHDNLDEACWKGYHKEGNKKMFGKTYPNCVKNEGEEDVAEEQCPECGGPMFSDLLMNEKKDACYYKVKSRYKVWPSAYASGALVKCRKSHGNWGNKSESIEEDQLEENLHKWFKEKWVRFGPDGKIRGDCARGDDSEGKTKCLPQSKAHALGKKGRASAAARKRREDPNPERHGKAINVNTKKKTSESTMNTESTTNNPEYTDEVGYVRDNIHTIVRMCKVLNKAMIEDENLPDWVQEKVANAKGMLVAATDYLVSQHEQGRVYTNSPEEMEEAASAAQQAAIAINMKKHHQKPKSKDMEECGDYAAMYESMLREFSSAGGSASIATAPGVGNGPKVGSLFGGSYSQKNSPFKKNKTNKSGMIKR